MGQYVLNISKMARLEGIKEGKIEGLHEGAINTLLQLLQSRFGKLSPKTIHQIQTSNDEQLHALTIHIFGINSEEDVLKILKMTRLYWLCHVLKIAKPCFRIDINKSGNVIITI